MKMADLYCGSGATLKAALQVGFGTEVTGAQRVCGCVFVWHRLLMRTGHLSIDWDAHHGQRPGVMQADVAEVAVDPTVDALFAGPPCQVRGVLVMTG